jgi:hypothetical protein
MHVFSSIIVILSQPTLAQTVHNYIVAYKHRIDTRPEGTLLCVLAEGKRPKFFYVLWRHPGVHTALCTYVFLWKTSVCTPGWRHMMAYFHVSTRQNIVWVTLLVLYLFCDTKLWLFATSFPWERGWDCVLCVLIDKITNLPRTSASIGNSSSIGNS